MIGKTLEVREINNSEFRLHKTRQNKKAKLKVEEGKQTFLKTNERTKEKKTNINKLEKITEIFL